MKSNTKKERKGITYFCTHGKSEMLLKNAQWVNTALQVLSQIAFQKYFIRVTTTLTVVVRVGRKHSLVFKKLCFAAFRGSF